jgi:hypothetical protein
LDHIITGQLYSRLPGTKLIFLVPESKLPHQLLWLHTSIHFNSQLKILKLGSLKDQDGGLPVGPIGMSPLIQVIWQEEVADEVAASMLSQEWISGWT